MLALTLALSLLAGVALGLFGGGGSILTVPILVYAAGLEAKEAIATSLVVVGVTSLAALVAHARGGRVRWRSGLLFGVAGMAGAYAGGRIAGYVPAAWLMVGFGIMMLATAVAMLTGRGRPTRPGHAEVPVARVLLDGVVVGLVTGLVGAGGGFLVVPALALLGGLPMNVAVGTSLLVIAMKSGAGLLGYLSSTSVDWVLAAAVAAAAVTGSLLGGALAGRVPQDGLRKGFAWFVVAMAVFVLVQQAPAAGLRPSAPVGLAGAALLAVAVGAGLWWRRIAR